MWEINREKSEPHWLEIKDGPYYSAIVKWDGCIEFRRHFNIGMPSEMVDGIHLCDIDDEIQRLINLKKISLEYFGEDWSQS